MNVPKVMKELRLKKKKSQREIAKVLDITRPAYVRYETGNREPSLETLSKLANYYEVPIQSFFMKELKKYKYENLYMAEIGTLYDIKYREMIHLSDFISFSLHQIDSETLSKGEVPDDLVELQHTYESLLEEFDFYSDEIRKLIDKDRKYLTKQ